MNLKLRNVDTLRWFAFASVDVTEIGATNAAERTACARGLRAREDAVAFLAWRAPGRGPLIQLTWIYGCAIDIDDLRSATSTRDALRESVRQALADMQLTGTVE